MIKKILREICLCLFYAGMYVATVFGVYLMFQRQEMLLARQSEEISKLNAIARYPIHRDAALLSEDKDLKRSLAELLAKTGLANKEMKK